jgi:DNA-binding response OmpR family regulator
MNLPGKPSKEFSAATAILFVDEDASVREKLGRLLAGEGYSVFLAASGAEALTLTTLNPIDLVLLNLNLPDRDGWDVCERLMAHDPQCKVIVITGRPDQQMKAIESGVDALIEKPVIPASLLYRIRSLLQETSAQRAHRLIGAYVNRHHAGIHAGITQGIRL